ncbi:c-type cytochrome biogenesis protein CcmI [Rhizobium straminoryzae]|uniref:C-type cytochrome biogenesis protein CcmI n=1 Tax=Rhizobium straminoryzae TaxID=1387186 RepID=A0A549SM63_9HYPH|nr:c-type cytochrome biogenesis protein CcmI [Rhizobium straminoryzae]TRL30684.1 c-type cytochrome biogenesis protein CcmI [Rhizobium straminoryzae]
MVLWIVLACFTALVAAILIAPLMRPIPESRKGHEDEAAVYRDQLREIERDRHQGLIGAAEADYARAEIGRRLLAVADKTARAERDATEPASRKHQLTTFSILLCLPLVGIGLYVTLGSPGLPAQPLEARLANPGNNMALLVAKAERHLAANPQDGAGWDLLAPIYFRSQRLGDAEMAYRRAIALLGETPDRLAGLGETLIAANDGVVTLDARQSFARAVELDRSNMRARFYLALSDEQAGRRQAALDAFRALAADSPPGAAWMALVNEHIARNGGAPLATPSDGPQIGKAPGKAPGNPDAAAVEAAQNMSAGERKQMIEGMVTSLAARLKDDPDNIEGWLRLVRSYKVLGEDGKATDALRMGLKTFPADGAPGQRLVALAREIGLSVEGVTQ